MGLQSILARMDGMDDAVFNDTEGVEFE